MTFLQSSFFDLLPLEFYVSNLNLTESLNTVVFTDSLITSNSLISTQLSSTDITILNQTISLLTPNVSDVSNEDSTYTSFLEGNLDELGLTESDFLGLFPSESLSNLDFDAVANSRSDLNLIHTLPVDQLDEYTNLEAVKSQYHSSVPLRKLQYPEPFIASASFVHTDIGFMHVLQYNY